MSAGWCLPLQRLRRLLPGSSASIRTAFYILTFLTLALIIHQHIHVTCPAGMEGERYISWEIPHWAYFNNQILLHVTVAAYNPLHSRRIVSPGFHFEALQGLSEPVTLRFDQMFLSNHTAFLSTSPPGILTQSYVYLKDVELLMEDGCGYAAELTNDREDLWSKMYTRFVVRVFLLGLHHDVRQVVSRLRYADPVRLCVEEALSRQAIAGAIGIHVRTWKRDVSLVKHPCEMINGKNPLRFLFMCVPTSDTITASINRVRTSPFQPIFLATDDPEHPVIKDLLARYPVVLQYNKSHLDTCLSRVDLSDTDRHLWSSIAHPMVENELLVHTAAFVGSFFSTFTQVAAIKRDMVKVEFFQTDGQRRMYRYRFAVGLAVVGGIMFLPMVGERVWRRR